MAEPSSLRTALLPLLPERPERNSYGQAREATNRAAVTQPRDTGQVQRALARLDTLLDNDQQPRDNVPRGYYINIRV